MPTPAQADPAGCVRPGEHGAPEENLATALAFEGLKEEVAHVGS